MSLHRHLPTAVIAAAAAMFAGLNIMHAVYFGPPWGTQAAPDLRVTGYDPDQVRLFLDRIGAEGRAVFFGAFRWLDMVFPPVLALSLLTLFRRLRAPHGGSGIALFALLPLAYLVADLTENRFLARLIETTDFDGLVQAASLATQIKYGALVLAFASLGILALRRTSSKGVR